MKNKPPSDTERLIMYEGFLHDLNTFASITMDKRAVGDLISNACDWSYAHRVGNGMLTDEEQEEIISKAFWKLRNISAHEYRHEEQRKENLEKIRDMEIIHVAKTLLAREIATKGYKSIDDVTDPTIKKLFIALHGTDDELRQQFSDSFGTTRRGFSGK